MPILSTGETEYNLCGRIGGDPPLSESGHRYADLLADYVRKLPHTKLKVWTSWLQRSIETTKYIDGVQER